MGHNVDIQTRYWGENTNQEMQIIYSNVLETLYTAELDERIPIGAYSSNINDYRNVSEFKPIIKPGSIVELSRLHYNGPDSVCCISDLRYGWVDTLGNISQTADLSKTLLTCDPRTIQVGYSNICDNVMFDNCITNMDQSIKSKCNVWLNGLYKRSNIDYSVIASINRIMQSHCTSSYTNTNCDIWLSAIRNSGNQTYFDIADLVLRSQNNKTGLECAFPPSYITNQALKIGTPRECWYSSCAFSPNYLLLTENIQNKTNCLLSECNININNLDIVSETEISLICKNTVTYTSSKAQSNIIQREGEYNRFLVPDNFIFFLLILIFLCLLIFWKN